MDEDKDTIDDLLFSDPEMIDSFITEAKEHLDSVEDDFLALEKQKADPDKALVNKIFRSIHSVKGAAGFLGLSNMTALAHAMETLLTEIRTDRLRLKDAHVDTLLSGVDLLTVMLDDVKHSNEIDITRIKKALTGFLEPTTPDDEESLSPVGDKAICEAFPASEQDEAEKDTETMDESDEPVQDYQSIPEKAGVVNFGSTIRINVDILDELMTLAGELVLVRNQHLLWMNKTDTVSRSISQRLNLITTELQETIIQTRMQPISKIFGKLPRIVRDLGQKLNKQVQIMISGGDSELDRTILESLADPMIHIIRNCCDHGIEPVEERIRAGKSKTGTIRLNAYHEAGRINIEIKDDGRGIDPERIRKKALKNRLKTEIDLEQMSTKEIYRLILLPGFSTADEINDVSGRGVGMDVVKTAIERLGGSVEIESAIGQGTVFYLKLPLTLAIISCLIVGVKGEQFAIPQVNLEELVCLYDEDVRDKIESANDQEVFRLRDRLLPMVRLVEILERPETFDKKTRAEITDTYRREQKKLWQEYTEAKTQDKKVKFTQSLNFAVLKVGTSRYGLIIDQIFGTEEIVVKPMHWAVKSLNIYSGATIMGNGKVALILDVEGIAAHAGLNLDGRFEDIDIRSLKNGTMEESQTVLLFKCGPKEQFAMALPLIRRIQPVSMKDIEEVGTRSYITVDGVPTLIIHLDRLLSVSPMVEKEEMFLIIPRHIKRPVAILISDLVDIEKTPVELNVRSYMEEGLLGTGIVKKAMTLFVDIYRLVELIEPEWFADRRKALFGTGAPPPKSEKRILLLEDASFFRHLVKGYLEADGYTVVTAENGQVGLEIFNEKRFDLIVSDLEMPLMDGWQFLRSVRKGSRHPDIPSIALTALDSESDKNRALDSGFNRYEVKLDRETFLTSVAEVLGVLKQ